MKNSHTSANDLVERRQERLVGVERALRPERTGQGVDQDRVVAVPQGVSPHRRRDASSGTVHCQSPGATSSGWDMSPT
jgi:hypothetical protein